MIEDYEKKVYTALLGKVIGVYLGRPFEGWKKEAIQEKWGAITRYVHADRGVPLVVADDDISGTLTFIRALTDSGLYEKTPDEFFGKTWLNYLIPYKTILWWGNMSCSTEHTAYIRLKQGFSSPESGSMKLNGKEVADKYQPGTYVEIPMRKWTKKDVVEVTMPFQAQMDYGPDKRRIAATGKNETRT